MFFLRTVIRRPVAVGARQVSSHIVFTPIDKTASQQKLGRLRVPLLKSPSHFGHFTLRINRLYNEDKYSASVLQLKGERLIFNFNIFDGHGGEQCAVFLANELSREIEESSDLVGDATFRDDLIKKYSKNIGGYWKRWYKQREKNFKAMLHNEKRIKLSKIDHITNKIHDDLNLRLTLSFLKADYDFFESDDNTAGSTCTSSFFETLYSELDSSQTVAEKYYFNRNTVSKLTIAHVGDTRAILVDRTGLAHVLTQSHHPSNPMEALRLRKYATNFFMTDSFGEERFIALANTRAFGDVAYKEMGVTAEPDISELIVGDSKLIEKKLTEEEIKNFTIGGLGGDESFLVLCTDGVTGMLTDQEIADVVMLHFNLNGQKSSPQKCAEEVIKFVEYVGGDDNATCLVVRLSGWGKWPMLDRTGELRQSRMLDYNPRSLKQS